MMNAQRVKLFDRFGDLIAVAQMAGEGDRWWGTIDLCCTPPSVRALFDEFDEIVNGQMLSFLDAIQEKTNRLGVKAAFENGCEVPVEDLQVYPSTGDVSFKLVAVGQAVPDGSSGTA